MAFPTTSVLDNFNRSDEPLGDSLNWTDVADTHTISSNEVTVSNNDTHTISMWSDSTFGADTECFFTIATHDPYSHACILRATTLTQASWDGYYVYADTGNDDIELFEVTNDSATQIGSSVAYTWADGDKIGGEIIGSTIKGYVDSGGGWSQKISDTDSTHSAAGYIGIRSYMDAPITAKYDDFGGGTISTDNVGIMTTNTGYWGAI